MVVKPAAVPLPLPEIAPLPRHVAVIMDGNGRWAESRARDRIEGHRAGADNIRTVIERFAAHGVEMLTLFAFSTENWGRPASEVDAIMGLASRFISRHLDALDDEGVRLRHIGDLDGLPPGLRRSVLAAVERTARNSRIHVNVAFNYGGREEILDAVRRIMADGVLPERLDEALFASYLYTADMPEPDLVIRTAGEVRLSNFLLWQSAYAEYYGTAVYWPDFDAEEIERALLDYSQRQRRFGGVVEDQPRDDRRPRRGNSH